MDFHSSDSDGDEKRPAVLPVDNFIDYDEEKAPKSGPEYLRRVQLEAAKCEKIVVSKTIPKPVIPDCPVSLTGEKRFIPCMNGLPLDVQRQIVAEFSVIRMQIEKKRTSLTKHHVNRLRKKYPAMTEYFYWHKYCLNMSASESESSEDEVMSGMLTSKRKATKTKPPAASKPNLRLLLSLDQNELLTLLMFVLKWCSDYGIDQKLCFWIYSILSVIEKPLISDAYSLIRDVSRSLSHARLEEELDPETVNSCHLIICIIGRYFNQLDMIDA
jgi:survival of motor neuron protein-interacting protein 1